MKLKPRDIQFCLDEVNPRRECVELKDCFGVPPDRDDPVCDGGEDTTRWGGSIVSWSSPMYVRPLFDSFSFSSLWLSFHSNAPSVCRSCTPRRRPNISSVASSSAGLSTGSTTGDVDSTYCSPQPNPTAVKRSDRLSLNRRLGSRPRFHCRRRNPEMIYGFASLPSVSVLGRTTSIPFLQCLCLAPM